MSFLVGARRAHATSPKRYPPPPPRTPHLRSTDPLLDDKTARVMAHHEHHKGQRCVTFGVASTLQILRSWEYLRVKPAFPALVKLGTNTLPTKLCFSLPFCPHPPTPAAFFFEVMSL